MNKKLVLIDSMQFMKSDDNLEYLTKEFVCENLRLLKQKGAYFYEHMISFERFNEEKLTARKFFF